MFKKSLIIFGLTATLTFTGCFGGGEEDVSTNVPSDFKTFNAASFSISVPAAWEILEPVDFTSDIPGGTQVIVRNNVKNDVFTANANVTKEILNSAMTSYDFGLNVMENNKKLKNYKEISRDNEYKILIGGTLVNSIMLEFEGKESEGQPTIRVVQTYAVAGADAYTVSSAYYAGPVEDLSGEIAEKIIRTFRVK
ncbi:hypothetical protein ACFL3T_01540 [Patescibacteria group bacterium]